MVRARSGLCPGLPAGKPPLRKSLFLGIRQLGSSGNRSFREQEWMGSFCSLASEDAGPTGPPGSETGRGSPSAPAGVGSSSEALSLGKAGLGVRPCPPVTQDANPLSLTAQP